MRWRRAALENIGQKKVCYISRRYTFISHTGKLQCFLAHKVWLSEPISITKLRGKFPYTLERNSAFVQSKNICHSNENCLCPKNVLYTLWLYLVANTFCSFSNFAHSKKQYYIVDAELQKLQSFFLDSEPSPLNFFLQWLNKNLLRQLFSFVVAGQNIIFKHSCVLRPGSWHLHTGKNAHFLFLF